MITIIDYDAGNIKSVQKACEALGEEVIVTGEPEEILSAERLILPGVGAFGSAMERLRSRHLDKAIRDYSALGRPILGICLGLQLFFEVSEESPGVSGLGILEGKIVRIPAKEGLRVPHMGWNNVGILQDQKLFKGIKKDPFMYFVHSYYLRAKDRSIVCGRTEYGVSMDIAVEKDHIFATQFHPEKSGQTGLSILKNFINL